MKVHDSVRTAHLLLSFLCSEAFIMRKIQFHCRFKFSVTVENNFHLKGISNFSTYKELKISSKTTCVVYHQTTVRIEINKISCMN